jgi:hypothetical protein
MGGFGWFLVGLFIGGSIGGTIAGVAMAASRKNYHPYRKGES